MNKFFGKRVAAVISALLMVFSIVSLPAGTALAASGEAKLLSLSVKETETGPELLGAFSQDNTNYTVDVGNSVTSVIISAAAEDTGASVSGTGTVSLNVGENNFDVACTFDPGTGELTNTYHIKINRADVETPDCTLSYLKVTADKKPLELSPAFDPHTYQYTLDIHTDTIEVTTAAEDPAATVTIENADYNESGLYVFSFEPGQSRLIRAVVTSADGKTAQNYDINATWNASSDCSLKSLKVTYDDIDLPLEQAFDPATYNYTLTVHNWVDTVEITAETNDPYADCWTDGEQFLNIGDNEIWIYVGAENGEDYLEYTITITRLDDLNTYKTDDGFIYEDRGSYIAILAYEGTEANITIPAEITVQGDSEATPVTVIERYAFAINENITGVTIPEGVTSINDGVFAGCSALKDVTLPSGLKKIGSYAFSSCTSLISIALPAGLKTIGSEAFIECTALESVEFPDGLVNIMGTAFGGCEKLNNVTLPDSVEFLGYGAFSGCTAFTSFTLPASLQEIQEPFLEGCINLETISAGTNTNFKAIDGVLFSADGVTLIKCPSAKSGTYEIPSGVEIIYEAAFDSCRFDSVSIPEGVTEICWNVFENCKYLATVKFPNSLDSIYDYAFQNCSSLEKVTLPKNLEYITGSAFAGCTSLSNILVDPRNDYYASKDGVLYSWDMNILIVFPAGKGTSYTVPFYVSEIGESAFASSRLTSINLGSVTYIYASAFEDCDGLTSVVIPGSVEYIEDSAFDSCDNLCSVTLGAGLEAMGYSFNNCPKLAAVYFLGNAPDIEDGGGEEGEDYHGEDYNDNDYYDYGPFDGCSRYFTVYYASGRTGFRNPWYGYPTVKFYPSSKCTVKFNLSGAPVTIPDLSVYKGGKAVQPLDPVWEGHKFLGWFKDALCKTPWSFAMNTVTSGITLYAKWDQEDNAYLGSLYAYVIGDSPYDVNELNLNREFNPSIFSYTAKLGEYEASFGVAVTPMFKDAKVTIDGQEATSKIYDVVNGDTAACNITVTSGSLTQTYTIAVTRAQSNNDLLSNIKYSPGVIATPFRPVITTQAVRLYEATESVTITPVKDNPLSKVYIDGKAVDSKEYKLDTGKNAVCNIKVVSQSGKVLNYKVNINRDKCTNAGLAGISTNNANYSITPAFAADKFDYSVYLPDNVSSVTLYATKADKYASTEFIDGTHKYKASSKSFSVANGAKKDITIKVTAQDGSTVKNYTVHILRASSISSFSALPKYSSYPSLSPGGSNRLTFTWKQYGAGNAKIEVLDLSKTDAAWKEIYTLIDASAGTHTFEWDGKIAADYLTEGNYTARISVTYKDDIKDYTLTSAFKNFEFKILPKAVPTVSASPTSFQAGGRNRTKITVKWNVITIIKVEILDLSNNLVATLWAPTTFQSSFANTLYWYGKYDKTHGGTAVPPGEYKIRVTAGGIIQETMVTLT